MEGFQFQFDDALEEKQVEETMGGSDPKPSSSQPATSWWQSAFNEAHRLLSQGDPIHERSVGHFGVSMGTHQATQTAKSAQTWIGNGIVLLLSGNIRVPKLEMAGLQSSDAAVGVSTSSGKTESQARRFEGQDIVPGVYLGGLKVWSCAPFLGQYLATEVNNVTWSSSDLGPSPLVTRALRKLLHTGGSVLELGCGHSVPSLALFKALLKARGGASPSSSSKIAPIDVTLLDFNEEVIDAVTLPNVRLNFAEQGEAEGSSKGDAAQSGVFHLSVAAGDWSKFVPSPSTKQYDLILGSDVTYDDGVTASVLCCIGRLLKPETGVALIGTKPFYFGTGGGFRAMEEIQRGLERSAPPPPFPPTGDGDVFAQHQLDLQVVLNQRDGDSMDRMLVAVRLIPKS